MPDDLTALAEDSARDAEVFLEAVTQIASGSVPDSALPMSLLALSQILVMGARLGAIEDVIPAERFEPDAGPEAELDPLREGFANLFDGIDEYADVVDPVTSPDLAKGTLSNDIAVVASALSHGLTHYREGRVSEALWWWQFSYLSDWGDRAAMALRVLQGVLSHVRLDADEDLVAEAEFDALHP